MWALPGVNGASVPLRCRWMGGWGQGWLSSQRLTDELGRPVWLCLLREMYLCLIRSSRVFPRCTAALLLHNNHDRRAIRTDGHKEQLTTGMQTAHTQTVVCEVWYGWNKKIRPEEKHIQHECTWPCVNHFLSPSTGNIRRVVALTVNSRRAFNSTDGKCL